MQDAPRTQSFTAQGLLGQGKTLKFLKKLKSGSGKKPTVGLGGSLYNDKNVLLSQTGAQVAYAYHIPLRGSTKISMGLALSAFPARIDKASVYTKEFEPLLSTAKPAYVIDASVGFLLSNRSYFAGISAMQVSQSLLNFGDKVWDKYQKFRHYYLVGGYNFDVNSDYTICPSALIRTTDKFYTFQTDISCKVIFMETFWGGFAYRTNKEIICFVGVTQNKMYFTYSFDFPVKPYSRPSFGSHELTMALKLGKPKHHRGIGR